MSRRKREVVEGHCYLCGVHGRLSFEHVPPESAFNHLSVLRAKVDEYWEGRTNPIPEDRLKHGFGDYTLCERCNNNTGSWYGAHFVDWCRLGMDFRAKTGRSTSLIYVQNAYPLS